MTPDQLKEIASETAGGASFSLAVTQLPIIAGGIRGSHRSPPSPSSDPPAATPPTPSPDRPLPEEPAMDKRAALEKHDPCVQARNPTRRGRKSLA